MPDNVRQRTIRDRLVMLRDQVGSESFTLDGAEDSPIPCVCPVIARGEMLEVGGLTTVLRGKLFVLREELPEDEDAPDGRLPIEPGYLLTFRGRQFRVASVVDIETTAIELHLADPET